MPKDPHERQVKLSYMISPQFSNVSAVNKSPRIFIYSDGDIAFGSSRSGIIKKHYKIKHEISNKDISKIETSTSSGEDTRVSIKITTATADVIVVQPMILSKRLRSIEAAAIPALLSTIYGERYSKL